VGENPSLGGVTPGELRGDRGGGRGRRKFPVPWVSNIDCCRPPGKVGRFVCLTHLNISERTSNWQAMHAYQRINFSIHH
jgi:hypothetical protein